MDHLRAVLGDAAGFSFASDHEAGDVLQEHERDAALVAQFDEVSRFERGLAEQDSIIGDDADGVSVNAREAADQSRAVARFELAEFTTVYEAGDDLVNIVTCSKSAWQNSINFFGRKFKEGKKIDGFTPTQRFFLSWAQVWRAATRDEEMFNRIKTDPHSPNLWRCNGPLSNMPEFYAAFGVKEGDKMYRPDSLRAKVW